MYQTSLRTIAITTSRANELKQKSLDAGVGSQRQEQCLYRVVLVVVLGINTAVKV